MTDRTEPVSETRVLAEALDGNLPRMAFQMYGEFYTADPGWDVLDYYARVAEEMREEMRANGVSLVPTATLAALERVRERAEVAWESLRHEDHGHPLYDLGRALVDPDLPPLRAALEGGPK